MIRMLVRYILAMLGLGLLMLYAAGYFLTWQQSTTSKILDDIEPEFTKQIGSKWITTNISCQKVFDGDKVETRKARSFITNHPSVIPLDEDFKIPTECAVLKSLGYNPKPLSEEERNFPIAISILMHGNLHQFENLLRLIYQPQNSYCIHVDLKAKPVVHHTVQVISKCFPNIYIADNLVNISYGGFSRLQADINCMKDLVSKDKQWKYLINIASSVLPLKTNLEMVKILRIYNGANDIEGTVEDWVGVFRLTPFKFGSTSQNPTPHSIILLKGSAYGAYSRAFMEWAFTAKEPLDLLEWCKKVNFYSPDEHYWASLHHLQYNPHLKTPGGYDGDPRGKPWLASYSAWFGKHKCYGHMSIHAVCLFGVGDLPSLVKQKALFANKFDFHRDWVTGQCMEELLRNRTLSGASMLDLSYYKKLPFIKKGSS